MKKLLVLVLLYSTATFAQEPLRQTQAFSISGDIKRASLITMDSLNSYPLKVIGDIKVTNHLGELKHRDEELKGVLLKEILSHSELTASPKLFSRFYFTCFGNDGYAVVYSWNELFNTEVGNHVFIIIESNGIRAAKLPESIQMTSATDFKTGRRYLHNLERIVVTEVKEETR